jgi:hypothetical protein
VIVVGLVVAAAALVVLGWVLQSGLLSAIALVLAVVAALISAAAVLRRRRAERAEETPAVGAPVSQAVGDTPVTAEPAEEPVPDPPAPDGGDAVVRVVPGRLRYHRAGCTLVGGRVSQQLTVDEAHEEGFTPCSRCVGDHRLVPARGG